MRSRTRHPRGDRGPQSTPAAVALDPVARRNSRLALAVAVFAAVAALAGVTPGEAARAVKRALNADKVDGISASRTPRPGHLLALGGNRRFPAAVLPLSARGPRGAQGPSGQPGPQGTQGPAGVSNIRVANGASIYLSPTGGASTQIARLDNVPAGSWLLTWTATMDHGVAQLNNVGCRLQAGPQTFARSDVAMGTAAGAHYTDVLGSFAATTQSATFSVQLLCAPGSDSAPPVHVDDQSIVAIRADTLDVTG